jgi:hypothetical protein
LKRGLNIGQPPFVWAHQCFFELVWRLPAVLVLESKPLCFGNVD